MRIVACKLFECVIVGPNLTGVCFVDFRNTSSMLLSWPLPNQTVPLTYRVSYLDITLNSSLSSAPNISFVVSEMPYLATNLLPGATYRVFVQALTLESAKSIGVTQLESEAISCIYTIGTVLFSIFDFMINYNAKLSITVSAAFVNKLVPWLGF